MKHLTEKTARAISPVIGTVLLVALVVILSTTVFAVTGQIVPSLSTPGTAAVSFDEGTNTGGVTVTVEHTGNIDQLIVETEHISKKLSAQAGDSVTVPLYDSKAHVFSVSDGSRTLLQTYQASYGLRPSGAAQYYHSGPHPSSSVKKPKYVERQGEYAFVVFQANPGYLVAYDVSDSSNPTVVDTVNVAQAGGPNGGYTLSIANDTLYVSQNGGSFTTVDITDPTEMAVESHVSTGGQGFDIATKGHYVYVADATGALRVFDAGDPANPTQVATRTVSAGGVAVEGDQLYVTDYPNNQILIYDISDPGAPSQIGSYSTSFAFPVPVEVSDNQVYVQKYGGSQVEVVDVSDPMSPSKVTTISTPGTIPNGGAVEVAGDRVFLITGQSGNAHISLYAADDLSTPIAEHTVPGSPQIGAGDVWGKFVYLPNYSDKGLTSVRVAS